MDTPEPTISEEAFEDVSMRLGLEIANNAMLRAQIRRLRKQLAELEETTKEQKPAEPDNTVVELSDKPRGTRSGA